MTEPRDIVTLAHEVLGRMDAPNLPEDWLAAVIRELLPAMIDEILVSREAVDAASADFVEAEGELRRVCLALGLPADAPIDRIVARISVLGKPSESLEPHLGKAKGLGQ